MGTPFLTKLTRVWPDGGKGSIWINRDYIIDVIPSALATGAKSTIRLVSNDELLESDKRVEVEEEADRISLLAGPR